MATRLSQAGEDIFSPSRVQPDRICVSSPFATSRLKLCAKKVTESPNSKLSASKICAVPEKQTSPAVGMRRCAERVYRRPYRFHQSSANETGWQGGKNGSPIDKISSRLGLEESDIREPNSGAVPVRRQRAAGRANMAETMLRLKLPPATLLRRTANNERNYPAALSNARPSQPPPPPNTYRSAPIVSRTSAVPQYRKWRLHFTPASILCTCRGGHFVRTLD